MRDRASLMKDFFTSLQTHQFVDISSLALLPLHISRPSTLSFINKLPQDKPSSMFPAQSSQSHQQRPDVPLAIWQTSMIPDGTTTSLYKSPKYPSSIEDPRLRDAVSRTLLHSPYYTAQAYIKYNPSLAYNNKIAALEQLVDDLGNPIDVPSFHPRLFCNVISTPQLFRPISNPFLQPFSYSSLNPIHAQTFKDYTNAIANSTSLCPNPYPTDGLSLSEFNVLQHAILAAIKALVDCYPLPRQILALSRSIVHLLFAKYPIYSFGPLHYIPPTIVHVSTKFFELSIKPVDLITKYNNLLEQSFPLSPLPSSSQPNLSIPWFQEFLPPYIFPVNQSEEARYPNPAFYLNQHTVVKYQHQLSHLLYFSKLTQDSRETVRLPYDQFELYANNLTSLPPPLQFADQLDPTTNSPTALHTSSTIMNKGLNGHTFNETWLQYLSSLNYLYSTKLTKSHSIDYTSPQRSARTLSTESTFSQHGSLLYQFLLLSLFLSIPEAIATTTIPPSKTGVGPSKPIIQLTQQTSTLSSSTPTVLPPSVILLDALIVDTLNFKAISIAATPLVDLSLALLDRCKITLPFGYTLADESSPFLPPITDVSNQQFDVDRLFPQEEPQGDGSSRSDPVHSSKMDDVDHIDTINGKDRHKDRDADGDKFDTKTQEQAVEELLQLLRGSDKQFIPENSLNEIPSTLNLPLLEFGLDASNPNRFSANDLLEFYPNLSNNNTLLHLASFVGAIANFAEALPLELFYPQQIVAIAIIDLALNLLQLPPPQLLPAPFHTAPDPQLTITPQSILPSTTPPLNPTADITNHILNPEYMRQLTDQYRELWDINNSKHHYIQNGFVQRPFTLNTPFHTPIPQSAYDVPTMSPSYWYHTVVPGLDPAIVQCIAVTVVEGTKFGHIVVNDTQTSKLTIRVLTQQRYPWFHNTTNQTALLSQLNTITKFDSFIVSHQRFHNLGLAKMIDPTRTISSDTFTQVIAYLKQQPQSTLSSLPHLGLSSSLPLSEFTPNSQISPQRLQAQQDATLHHTLAQLPITQTANDCDTKPQPQPATSQNLFSLLPQPLQDAHPATAPTSMTQTPLDKVPLNRGKRRAMILHGQTSYYDILRLTTPNPRDRDSRLGQTQISSSTSGQPVSFRPPTQNRPPQQQPPAPAPAPPKPKAQENLLDDLFD